jgi:hypothetical protein
MRNNSFGERLHSISFKNETRVSHNGAALGSNRLSKSQHFYIKVTIAGPMLVSATHTRHDTHVTVPHLQHVTFERLTWHVDVFSGQGMNVDV